MSYREETHSKNKYKWKACPKSFSASENAQVQEQFAQGLLFHPVFALGVSACKGNSWAGGVCRWGLGYPGAHFLFNVTLTIHKENRKTTVKCQFIQGHRRALKNTLPAWMGDLDSKFFSVCFLTFSFVVISKSIKQIATWGTVLYKNEKSASSNNSYPGKENTTIKKIKTTPGIQYQAVFTQPHSKNFKFKLLTNVNS